MRERGHRFASVIVREVLFAASAFLAAWLFLNHEILYLTPVFEPRPLPPGAYLLTAGLAYVFVRGLVVLVAWRLPHRHDGTEVCPECGQPYEDGTPTRVRVRTPGAPDPTAAARRAVAAARAARLPRVHAPPLPRVPIANRLAEGTGRDGLA